MERGVVVVIAVVDVSAFPGKRTEDIGKKRVVGHAGNVMKRCGVVGRHTGWISTSLDQELAELKVSC